MRDTVEQQLRRLNRRSFFLPSSVVALVILGRVACATLITCRVPALRGIYCDVGGILGMIWYRPRGLLVVNEVVD